jgi:hypothetical protein
MKTAQHLQHLKAQVQAIVARVGLNFANCSDDQLNFKGAPDTWSILECFEHLNLYNQYYLSAAESAISKAKPGVAELKYTWIGRKSIAMMHPSNTKKQKAFKRMVPSRSELSRDVLATFLNDQERILNLVGRALPLDVTSSVVPVEFFKLLKMNVAETIEFIVVHQERHLLQAERILTTLRSSSSPVLSI